MSEDPTLERMESFLENALVKHDGKFCFDILFFPVSSWNITMFRAFLKSKVQKGILKTEKDDLGRVWYSRA